ncbi:hypothetical protein AMATHDRAFT_148287 [Amanita thiersii Skay4041]|uniref:Alanine dehydrogenase/pyridine nucleotide transhydrogenase N-terminal domain-containing protein n=1 Tax=Amanita thiersii Skay4041 TaxID=703135 RepID=A0A2A9NEW6_9AGAR|nr:hypothetical protein AMATHDRAFT_148287 [Amanita thiersii Skay4041]
MTCLRRTHLRRFYSTARPSLTVGIRYVLSLTSLCPSQLIPNSREDPQRIWERRAPLTPEDVNYLVTEKQLEVHVEPCERRVFPTSEYVKAGAKIEPSLRNAHIIIGIKETPLDELIISPVPTPRTSNSNQTWSARTHMMFSHTVKGQPYNMPLLSRFLASTSSNPSSSRLLPRLVDYELLTNETDGKRTVGFGWFAGVAGVLESLSAMAHAHLEIGVASPFLYTPRPHTLPSLDRLRAALREIGTRIAQEGTPQTLGPFVIGVTGTGNVAQGCLSMLSELPIQHVAVKDLDALIYLVHAKPADYLVRSDGQPYDRASYYASPHLYSSVFSDKIAPYLTLFLNGVGWSPAYPRLMNNLQLVTALRRAQELGGARFTNIGDITCDVEGGLEFMNLATTLSSPFFKITPQTKPGEPPLPEVQVMSVDILPTSIPFDASRHFSNALMPYLERVLGYYSDMNAIGKEDWQARALERASVAVGGALTGKHAWLQEGVDKCRSELVFKSSSVPEATEVMPSGTLKKKRVLLLGSGMVAGPAVGHIAQRNDVELVVASNIPGELQSLAKRYSNVNYKSINMSVEGSLSSLVAGSDVVIRQVDLLPAALHVQAAELCIQHKKHLVTASYISSEMRSLHDRAVQAGIILLNEIGLDPGIDHCSTHSLLAQFKREGKHVVSFTSFCGGFPAPESVNGVPLGYKFSWTPRGVLSAALNNARFMLGGRICDIPGDNLLKTYFTKVPVGQEYQEGRFVFEGLANRDSLPYVDTYGLGSVDGLRTVLRGTLRYPGFARLMYAFKKLGLLEPEKRVQITEWAGLIPTALARKMKDESVHRMSTTEAVNWVIKGDEAETVLEAAKWLGIAEGEPTGPCRALPRIPTGDLAPLDLFALLLGDRLRYEPGERDMVVLSHEFVVRRGKDDAQEEVYNSSLIAYGDAREGGYTAMARTVGIPVAIAALRVLDGKVSATGVVGPSEPSVYEPVLDGLERVGLGIVERKIGGGGKTVEKILVEGFRQ